MKKMKDMMKINIRRKFTIAVAIATAFLVGIAPITVFAQSNEHTEETKAVETISEPIMKVETVTETKEETYGPLTPDGNMTLVDDYGSIEAGGKQFITVVTKSGNFFYIIIDRDDQGNETVHFLNMVDESDILRLMDDAEAKKYVESIKAPEEETTKTEEEVTGVTTKVTEPATKGTETEKTLGKSSSKTGLLVSILVVTIGGIAGYIYLKNSKKKNTKKTGQDPDADYSDEDEYFLSDLPEDGFKEEVDEEEMGESELIEKYDEEKDRED